MKKIVIVCGLIGGLVVILPMLLLTDACYKDGNFEGGMVIGYTSMLLAFSMVFVGIRNYRNKYNNGLISFGKAFKVGFFIVLIASTIYVIAWLISYYNFMPDFAEKYGMHMINQLKASGASQAKIDAATKEMADFAVMYKKPYYVILFTYIEIVPVGLLVTLISSLILKRKKAVAA
ncbi:MAG TPA: DUF4199 domain-containing protein [Ferruginibacter sp.]|nr:DUF4199 domain-containing protein [Ferruginibacter sp.]